MPTKIVNLSTGTSAKEGRISQDDLTQMFSAFQNEVALTPLPPRSGVFKRFCFYFTKTQIEALLQWYEETEDADALEVAIGVQVPGSIISCGSNEIDISHDLSVVISMANKATAGTFNGEGDYVLIDGYSSSMPNFINDKCCPNSKPPRIS